MIRGKKIFITGGCGFIGSTLVERLIEHNTIVVFDNMRRDVLTTMPVANHAALRIVRGDVEDYPALREAMDGAQIVVHCAAIAGIDTVIKRPVDTMRVNFVGTANVLEAARHVAGIERVLDFSTSEVFGTHAFRADETAVTPIGAVGEARWTYAVSKIASEHLAHAYGNQYRLPITVIRPFNIYGPGQMGESAMRTFILRALKDEDLEIHGDGNQIRAWCYIDDLIQGLILCLSHPGAVGESFNIGNARAVITVYGLAQTVIRVLGAKSRIAFSDKHYADVELRVPQVGKAETNLGFKAKVDLEDGIRETAKWYRSRGF